MASPPLHFAGAISDTQQCGASKWFQSRNVVINIIRTACLQATYAGIKYFFTLIHGYWMHSWNEELSKSVIFSMYPGKFRSVYSNSYWNAIFLIIT